MLSYNQSNGLLATVFETGVSGDKWHFNLQEFVLEYCTPSVRKIECTACGNGYTVHLEN
jgi:hypothetical protein